MEESPHAPVSRTRLESLNTEELIKLADTYGVDIPPELERIFIIEEILEIINAEKEETEPPIEVNPSYSESALLPKQYNISYVEVIIRDPLWIFVFWEIKGHDREIHESAKDFGGYFLRVIPLDNEGKELNLKENAFTVLVTREDSARYLGFAGETAFYDDDDLTNDNSGKQTHSDAKPQRENSSNRSNCFKIKLGVARGSNEIVLASSASFVLPPLYENEKIAIMSRNPLLRLSGVQNLSIIRNTDRHRSKR